MIDSILLQIHCCNQEIAQPLMITQQNNWLGDLKIAMIIKPELNIYNVIEGLAEKLSLYIKNFETRSEAILWLLFDKA